MAARRIVDEVTVVTLQEQTPSLYERFECLRAAWTAQVETCVEGETDCSV